LIISASGLITITGGKWTTYRRMAQDTVEEAIKTASLSPRASVTKNLPVHGNKNSVDRNDHLYIYGSDRDALLQLINENPECGEKLHPAFEYTKAEVIWAVKHEMARTVEDVLARRVRALFLDAQAAIEMAPIVAQLIATELKLNDDWIKKQIVAFTHMALKYLLIPLVDKG
ncbi:MAG: glycerol-3-phosphate dehydrogenase C-terminal domain-containing protein, partial [Mucilaginibacter sp.]